MEYTSLANATLYALISLEGTIHVTVPMTTLVETAPRRFLHVTQTHVTTMVRASIYIVIYLQRSTASVLINILVKLVNMVSANFA